MSSIDLTEVRLPEIFSRNNRKCYLDPIRKKLIYITPEETVRQKVVSYLMDNLEVPKELIFVEQPLSHYGIKTRDRADIVIHERTEEGLFKPIAVIECKAESVLLDENTYLQAQRYSDGLEVEYMMFTNGHDQYCFKYNSTNNRYDRIIALPKFAEMLNGDYSLQLLEEPPERIPFNRLEEVLPYSDDISCETPRNLAIPILNLCDGLLDESVKMPRADYGLFRLIEDYGVRLLTYGNGGGGSFWGPYRSFIVEVEGSTEFFSIGCSPNLAGKTCINVAHDDEEKSHHALQLAVEDNVTETNNIVKFYHHGRIAVGRRGSGKVSELRDLVSRWYPSIIDGNRFYLGSVKNDHLLLLDEPDVITLVVNLISYAIVRDEYRKMVLAR